MLNLAGFLTQHEQAFNDEYSRYAYGTNHA